MTKPLTADHLYKAGARLVRTGGYSDDNVRAWAQGQGLNDTQIGWVLQGAQDERNNGRGGRSRLGK